MKELQQILKTFENIKKRKQSANLATVVKTSGSVYRRPGARLLYTDQGKAVGTLSGGCLERDVCYHMEHSLSSGKPLLVTYDTTTEEDLYFGLGLGCNGVVKVLIEQLSHQSKSLNFLADCWNRRIKGVLATVFCVDNLGDVQIGDRLTLDETNNLSSEVRCSQLTQMIALDGRSVLDNHKSAVNQYQINSGKVEVFLEFIQPPPCLIIFGAQGDVLPLATMATSLGWRVVIVDTHISQATLKNFPMVDEVILTRPEIAHSAVKITSESICVVMTHNYLHDLELLRWLLPTSPLYLGILGPRHRSQRLLKDLESEGIKITAPQLERLYTPVGLDIGAETPEAIAVSILAEIQAVLNNREGHFLRDRKFPIH